LPANAFPGAAKNFAFGVFATRNWRSSNKRHSPLASNCQATLAFQSVTSGGRLMAAAAIVIV
jgi:hypothetical protein